MAKRWRTTCTDCNWEEDHATEAAAALAPHDCAVIVAFPEDPWERALAVEGLVRAVAFETRQRIPESQVFDFDDLLMAGRIGAYQAALRWDPENGAKFTTFARHRITGEMLDFLRDMDNSSRTERSRGVTYFIESIDELMDQRVVDGTPHPGAYELAQAMQRGVPEPHAGFEEMEALRAAWHVLTEREVGVLQRYFWDEIKMHVIAKEMGVTESRVCQIIGKATGKLRRQMNRALAV